MTSFTIVISFPNQEPTNCLFYFPVSICKHFNLKANSFIKFCLIGLFNTGLNYLVFYLLISMKFNPLLAGSMGFLSGAVTGFILNRRYTFASDISFFLGFKKYFILQLVCLSVHFCVQFFFLYVLLFPKLFSQIPGIFFTSLLNYFLSRKYVF